MHAKTCFCVSFSMSTVAQPRSARLQVSFGPIPRHYAVGIDVCRRIARGAVVKAAGVIAQRWWRTVGDEVTQDQAQAGLDRVCVRLDGRKRVRGELTPRSGHWPMLKGCVRCRTSMRRCRRCRTVRNQARISFRRLSRVS